MMSIKFRFKMVVAGVILSMIAATPVMADDIEIYTSLGPSTQNTNPNIMFIVDTSGSMSKKQAIKERYDSTNSYGGACVPTALYFATDGETPDCATSNDYFDEASNTCDHSIKGYDFTGSKISPPQDGSLQMVGTYSDQLAQFDPVNKKWRGLAIINSSTDHAYKVECRKDSGIHGGGANNVDYIEDGGTGWTNSTPVDVTNPHPVWYNGENNVQLYSGNYLNYVAAPTPANVGDTPVGNEVALVSVQGIEIVKSAINTMVRGNTQVDIGLMRFDGKSKYEGGSITYPILDVGADRNDFFTRLKTLSASGFTPLSEAYYEALLYFGGKLADYGSKASPSNETGTTSGGVSPGATYNSPIGSNCDKNYIVLLSDGTPTDDFLRTTRRNDTNLPGFAATSCNNEDDDGDSWNDNKDAADSVGSEVDNCLDELAGWANTHDVAELAIPAHDGEQLIFTHTIGFALSDPDAVRLLTDTAKLGGGGFYTADNEAELIAIFDKIIAGVLKVNSTFSSPAVSVNAFNRATNLDDLFFTLFKPTDFEHWEGNLKKFKLEFDAAGAPFVADVHHKPAIDFATGFFKVTSESYWTAAIDAPDGAETAKGGAAGNIVLPRNLYTFAGTYSGSAGVLTPNNGDLTSWFNKLSPINFGLNEAMLGIVGKPDIIMLPSTVVTYRNGLLKWARGRDVKDANGDNNSFDERRNMGDPLHAEPALVQYGELPGNVPDLVAYVATNDGYLHGFDSVTGKENFAFVPQEMLPKLQIIFEDTGIYGKAYGLDGNVVPWINDVNRDGDLLDAGEHVYLYFGMRRGGKYIYSMDVTDRNSPKLRWVIEGGVGDFAELGQTWSAPNVEKIKMGSVEKTVLIFGAGYDVAQDSSTERSIDSVGRGIFIVDADTGELLWRAGPDIGADLVLSDMKYSIPARIKPIDVDGDGITDRLYTGDMGGQLWRIDIDNEASTTGTLKITGGRIADLAIDVSPTDNRRFYNSPDVALILEEGKAPYISIVAASGYRAHPLQTDTHDRVYMIRDYDVYKIPATYTTVTEANLFDTTDNTIGQGTQEAVNDAKDSLNGKQGWFITLQELNGDFVGEKALSEPLILNGVAVFTTYIPASAGLATTSCSPNDGSGALYFVNVIDGTPTKDNTGDDTKTREDRRVLLARGGIPPTPRVIITTDAIPTLCVGTECSKADDVGTMQKMYWYEVEE